MPFVKVDTDKVTSRDRLSQHALAALGGIALAIGALAEVHLVCSGNADLLCKAVAESPPWTLLGALVAAPSVLWSWILRTQHKDEENRLALDQHVTAQINECLEMLSKKKETYTQIGAIYVLERLVREAPQTISVVMNVLCAFLRTQKTPPQTEEEADQDEDEIRHVGLSPDPAMQAALDVLGRLPPHNLTMDLHDCDLRALRLNGNFDRANFAKSWMHYCVVAGTVRDANYSGVIGREFNGAE